ncbi:MAG: hypothetical protein PVF74_03925 [Anaerolineales bacterium]|jgi:hypothetical protein
MKTVIGLYPHDRGFSRVKRLLKLVGFEDDDIQVLTNEEVIHGQLSKERPYLIAKNASLDTISLVALFSVVGLLASWCGFNLFAFGNTVAIIIILSALLLGAIMGISLGVFIGESKFKHDLQLYSQGVQHGDKVIAIQATHKEIRKAKRILTRGSAIGVRTL